MNPPVAARRLTVSARGLSHVVWEEAPTEEVGSARPTVLLLHGFMDAAASFGEVARALARAGHRVLSPDQRGFGDAPRAPGGATYYFPDYVLDVADIVDALVPAPAPLFVAGHSMGGAVATLFAGTFPERVARLAVLEGLGPPDAKDEPPPARLREFIDTTRRYTGKAPRPMPTFDDVVARLRMNHPGVPEVALRRHAPGLVREVEGGFVWAFDPLHRSRSPYAFNASTFAAFAAAVACPVLLVSGGVTGYHPADEDERAAAFRTVERVVLEDAGHMMQWTRPAELANALLRFFAAPDAALAHSE